MGCPGTSKEMRAAEYSIKHERRSSLLASCNSQIHDVPHRTLIERFWWGMLEALILRAGEEQQAGLQQADPSFRDEALELEVFS